MDGEAQSPTIAPLADCAVASEDLLPFLRPEGDFADKRFARIGFALFLLANMVLIVRPADLYPPLLEYPIYEPIMIACLMVSLPRLMHQFWSRRIAARPITQLIFAMCCMIVISHLARGSIWDARTSGAEFFKIFLYYMALLSWVDSPSRMRKFLLWLCLCIEILIVFALLQYVGTINLPALSAIKQSAEDLDTGGSGVILRLCGTGIFHDPNDLCLMLVVAMAICFYFSGDRKFGFLRFGMLIPVGVFGYAMTLTYSRGGLISLVAAIVAMLIARHGIRRAILLGALLLPIMMVVFAGRQTHVDLDNPEDTFQTRLDCWSDALTLFKESPVFGCGTGQQSELRGHVAHNSFIQSYAEMGFVGGACFFGAFALAIKMLYRKANAGTDSGFARLRPYVLGTTAGYAAGLLTLSRAYAVPTYLVLGIAATYLNLTSHDAIPQINGRFIRRLATASVLLIIATYLFVRTMTTV